MASRDVDLALADIRKAWRASCKDYDGRKLNSERCLQSSFYFHLRKLLDHRDSTHTIFIEATVKLPSVAADEPSGTVEAKSKRIAIDTLICKDREILVAIELKYAPRAIPSVKDMRKDIASLFHIRNHTAKERRVVIELVRHRATAAGDPMSLKISKDAKMLVGVFCSDAFAPFDAGNFWKAHRPSSGPWAKRRELPPRFGLCIAYAPEQTQQGKKRAKATPHFVGAPFGTN